MSALLLDLQPGDEVIMPSYTFVSTANAFVLRGAVPVFVDIREDTLNLTSGWWKQPLRRVPGPSASSTTLASPVKWIRWWTLPPATGWQS